MSLIMLAMFGLGPISQALSGALVKVSLPTLFVVAGAGMALTGVLAFTQRNLWRFPSLEEDESAGAAAGAADPAAAASAAELAKAQVAGGPSAA